MHLQIFGEIYKQERNVKEKQCNKIEHKIF